MSIRAMGDTNLLPVENQAGDLSSGSSGSVEVYQGLQGGENVRRFIHSLSPLVGRGEVNSTDSIWRKFPDIGIAEKVRSRCCAFRNGLSKNERTGRRSTVRSRPFADLFDECRLPHRMGKGRGSFSYLCAAPRGNSVLVELDCPTMTDSQLKRGAFASLIPLPCTLTDNAQPSNPPLPVYHRNAKSSPATIYPRSVARPFLEIGNPLIRCFGALYQLATSSFKVRRRTARSWPNGELWVHRKRAIYRSNESW